jgi:hypothetical protein
MAENRLGAERRISANSSKGLLSSSGRRRLIYSGYLLLLMVPLLTGSSVLFAQEAVPDTSEVSSEAQMEEVPRVYIDCGRCDYDHIRREITFVNYVRDQALADIHVFITDEGTGGGGREYEFSFIGRREFSGLDYTLTHHVDRNASWDETRTDINRVLRMGLGTYMMQTSLSSNFSLEYDEIEGQSARRAVNDPWNYWVFNIYAGSLQLGLESSRSEFDSRWGFSANRVTEEWKLFFRPYFNFEQQVIDQEDDEAVRSRRHRHGVYSRAVKSLNEHWSVGAYGNYLTRNDRNLKHRLRFQPGVEYSLFPYEEATRKAITFTYRMGYAWVDYYEETIFRKKDDLLLNHELEASVHVRQPWGDIQTGLVGSHYFHDVSKRRAEFFTRFSVRLTDGLELDFQTDLELIRDQLSLPRGDTSLEDILLRQRELATDFSLSTSIGLSYTFGSDFANVVNTRFY